MQRVSHAGDQYVALLITRDIEILGKSSPIDARNVLYMETREAYLFHLDVVSIFNTLEDATGTFSRRACTNRTTLVNSCVSVAEKGIHKLVSGETSDDALYSR